MSRPRDSRGHAPAHATGFYWTAYALLLALGTTASGGQEATAFDVGARPLVTLDGIEALELDPYLELLEDPDGILTFRDVRSPALAGRFAASRKESPNYGFTSSTWWVRFTLVNDRADDRELSLRQDYPLIDFVDLWTPIPQDEWQHHETGDRRPFAARDIDHRDFVFPLTVPARSETTYFMRFRSSGPVDISLAIYTPNALIRTIGREQLAYGIYYGGFLVLVFYNFFIFAVVRDRAFLYYLLYVTSYGTYMSVHNGLAYQFLWPRNPWWGNQSLIVFLGLTLLWGLQFSRTFLDAPRHTPRLDRLAFITQVVVVVGFSIAVFAPYRLAIMPASVVTVLTTALILAMGTATLVAGYRPARYFMLAWTALLAGVLVYMLKTFGLLPHTSLTQNGFQVGSLLEMVLLSLALASRVDELRKQSLTDPLTSLFNRRFFDAKLTDEIGRAERYNTPLSLLMIDIDHFKQFNDRHGHSKGDDALRAVAERLRQTAREQDILCRHGGEEFSVILPATDSDDAVRLAERLRTAVQSGSVDGERLTVSIGVASLSNAVFDSAVDFLDAADQALYGAKRAGRDRVVVFRSGSETGRTLTPTSDAPMPPSGPDPAANR